MTGAKRPVVVPSPPPGGGVCQELAKRPGARSPRAASARGVRMRGGSQLVATDWADKPAPNIRYISASVRLTRSARRHGDTESGFEVGLCAGSSMFCSLGSGILYHGIHRNALRASRKEIGKRCASHVSTTFPHHNPTTLKTSRWSVPK